MPLMSFGTELVDVTEGANGVIVGALPLSGPSNIERFRAIIATARAGYDLDRLPDATGIPGKILYLPAGRYFLENARPDEWSVNLWDHREDPRASTRVTRRNDNPFGASLRITAELTLWLAPGAVLVPDSGCIVHLQCGLVCEAVQIFDLARGGLVVFGDRVPKVLPEWWGVVPGRDSSRAIQHAIDAAIHHRYNAWEILEGTNYKKEYFELPPIPVELRGDYQITRTIEIRGGSWETPLLRLLNVRAILGYPPEALALPLAYTTDFELPGDTDRYFTDLRVSGPSAVATVSRVRAHEGTTDPQLSDRRIRITTGSQVGEIQIVFSLSDSSTLLVRVVVSFRQPREVLVYPITTVGGVWQGREAQGARLTGMAPFDVDGTALLRLVDSVGLTVCNLQFDVGALRAPRCLEIVPSPRPNAMQGMSIRRCQFRGEGVTLLQFGPAPDLVGTTRDNRGLPVPVARYTNPNSDALCTAFDDCDFRPTGGGVGFSARSGQSVPFRLRGCSFVGTAKTMILVWAGTFLLDGCTFENSGYTRPPGEYAPGFEPPDGADIFLVTEPARRSLSAGLAAESIYEGTPGVLGSFTAMACVSRSAKFLSTPTTPLTDAEYVLEGPDWPVLLVNNRHVPATSSPDAVSVQWGRKALHSIPTVQLVRGRATARMAPNAPLVVVGGQYHGSLKVTPGAITCAFVGPRGLGRELMRVDLDVERFGLSGFVEVFCLPVDQVGSVGG